MIRENYIPCAVKLMMWQYRHKVHIDIIFKDDLVNNNYKVHYHLPKEQTKKILDVNNRLNL